MSDPDAPLNSDQTSQIDNACDALESAWQSGKEPHLSEFVAGQTAEQRQACFVELAKVDLEWRLCDHFGRCRYNHELSAAGSVHS